MNIKIPPNVITDLRYVVGIWGTTHTDSNKFSNRRIKVNLDKEVSIRESVGITLQDKKFSHFQGLGFKICVFTTNACKLRKLRARNRIFGRRREESSSVGL